MFLFKNLTANPADSSYVISDLFPIRNDSDWQTFFELLNINSIINAHYSINTSPKYVAKFYFFDSEGNCLGVRNIGEPGIARQTIEIKSFLDSELRNAVLFSVFHEKPSNASDIGDSLIAERGYTGFEYKSNGARSYVHGNHDAIAFNGTDTKLIGNSGYRSRYYYVQHPIANGDKYEFLFVNTTTKKQKIEFQISNGVNKWKKISNINLKPGGSHMLPIDSQIDSVQFLRIKSHLYLARPVVFRTNTTSFDVFHG
jgi:hypothetical protein